jgi:hypothetical protein
LFGRWPDDLRTELDLLVSLEPQPDTDTVEMRGTIRNATPINGEPRLGNRTQGWRPDERVTVRGAFASAR